MMSIDFTGIPSAFSITYLQGGGVSRQFTILIIAFLTRFAGEFTFHVCYINCKVAFNIVIRLYKYTSNGFV